MVKTKRVGNGNSVSINEDGIIEVILNGPQTGQDIKTIKHQIEVLANQQTDRGLPVLVLSDITAIKTSDMDAESRTASRELIKIRTEGSAILGPKGLLGMTQYAVKLMRPASPIKYFTSRRQASKWLNQRSQPKKIRPTVSLVAGVFTSLIGLSALVGWQINDARLQGVMTTLRPMNPMAAVGLIVVSVGFYAYWINNLKYLRISGALGIALGAAALLPLHIDNIFYGDKVIAYGPHAQLADSAAICFIAMGVVGLIARRKQKWVPPVEYLAVAILGAMALFNVYGQLYAHDFIYGLDKGFVMALNLAIAFVAASISLVLLVVYRKKGDVLGQVPKIGWLVIVALLLVQIATYGAWSQAVNRNVSESNDAFNQRVENLHTSVTSRLQAYNDALRGFRGFYAASDYVSEGDFKAYYDALSLTRNYPGLRSMAFIAVVPDSGVNNFLKQVRQDTSVSAQGNPGFSITSKSTSAVHYVATYAASNDSPVVLSTGLDLTSVPGREKIYSSAVASGHATASGSITFLKTAKQPSQKGFFITIPVKKTHSDTYIGVVNANFNYKDFFPALLHESGLTKDLDISFNDKDTQIFKSDMSHRDVGHKKVIDIPVANKVWELNVSAAKNFGISANQAGLPRAILFIGQLLTLLMAIIFIMQSRARKQAMDLADDVTLDLKEERNHIVELHEKDEAILGGIGEGLIALSPKGIIERINPAAEKLLGMSEKELVSKFMGDMVSVSDMDGKYIPPMERPTAKAIAERKSLTTKLYYERKNGQKFPVELNVSPVVMGDKVIGAIEVFRDITHEYELDKAKSEFVSLASHQLRTPLSAVNWFAEMLLNGDAGKLNKDQHSYIQEIYEGNQRMVELVNALLDVSRLELGRMVNNPEPTDMANLVNDLEKELTASINVKQLKFGKELQEALEPVQGDPKLLRIIVQNLISNAVKYTPEKGEVRVVLRKASEAEAREAHLNAGPHIYFSVSDNGFGIPKAQQRHIFEKLFRADNVRKMDVEGTGLGLYLVKQVAESLGGKVWFKSEESKGTTFHVIIPFKTKVSKPSE